MENKAIFHFTFITGDEDDAWQWYCLIVDQDNVSNPTMKFVPETDNWYVDWDELDTPEIAEIQKSEIARMNGDNK